MDMTPCKIYTFIQGIRGTYIHTKKHQYIKTAYFFEAVFLSVFLVAGFLALTALDVLEAAGFFSTFLAGDFLGLAADAAFLGLDATLGFFGVAGFLETFSTLVGFFGFTESDFSTLAASLKDPLAPVPLTRTILPEAAAETRTLRTLTSATLSSIL
ncbi:unnamed protein product [Hymenolepis diminuta]|uniref:Uncharacterized protein n=1 Tax=Hymenolepis diminuta TaxID=6216 RepID=A0A564YIN4_HYMDI|nr:unnamed protein product [Hymenolepis diminuta]